MKELLLILSAVVYVGLVATASVRPVRSKLSSFELKRRSQQSDDVKNDVLRERYVDDIATWLRIKTSLLVVMFVLLLVAALGWLLGVVIAVFGVLQYGALARIAWVQTKSQALYGKIEPFLLDFAAKHGAKVRFLRGVGSDAPQLHAQADSREELLHIIEKTTPFVTENEKKLLRSGLAFSDKTVESIMTPRSVIDSIAHDDLLGPLTLDELHKTGHSRFPVIDGDIDHVVGMLHLRDVVALDEKKSVTASKAMKTPVYYIKDTQTLDHALAAFLKTRNLLFVVVNEYRETVGVVSLEDVIEVLLGRKIMDEFDAHEDLRKVAERNPRANNRPRQHKDV